MVKHKNVNSNDSLEGFRHYLHSVLIRGYSLIESKTSLLLITFKEMIILFILGICFQKKE